MTTLLSQTWMPVTLLTGDDKGWMWQLVRGCATAQLFYGKVDASRHLVLLLKLGNQ